MKFPYLKEALCSVFHKPATQVTPAPAAPDYRGRIIYHAESCINCGLCMRVCSPGAITREIEKVEEGDRITLTFDLTSCTFCAMCADFCAKKAIELSDDYNMVGTVHEDFLVSGSFVKKPIPKPDPAKIAAAKAAALAKAQALQAQKEAQAASDCEK